MSQVYIAEERNRVLAQEAANARNQRARAAWEQMMWDRQRQAFQESIIAKEQARRNSETAQAQQIQQEKLKAVREMFNGLNGFGSGFGNMMQPVPMEPATVNLHDNDGKRIGGSFAASQNQMRGPVPQKRRGGFDSFAKSLFG
jgi:hypothetical protein